MQNASVKSADQIKTSVKDVEQICQAQENFIKHLDELERLMDREDQADDDQQIANAREPSAAFQNATNTYHIYGVNVTKDQNYYNLVKL